MIWQVLFICECYRICIRSITSMWSGLSTSHWETHDQSPPSLSLSVLYGSGKSHSLQKPNYRYIFLKIVLIYFVCKLMSRLWHIFWYQHHPLQLQGWMIGNQIGGKMSSQRWPLFLSECHSYLLVLLLWAHSSLVTSFVPAATPCEFSCFFSFFSASVTKLHSRYCWCWSFFHSTNRLVCI